MNKQETTSKRSFEELKLELKTKARCGLEFMFAASVIWMAAFVIWRYLPYASYEKSVFTFIVGGLMLPLALALSKLFKTTWKIKDNPLQPLGMWLNFAQLIYFPFLFFILVKYPDYFIMAYAIITGAHLFPYAWLYDEKIYAFAAIGISVSVMLMALIMPVTLIYYIPLATSIALFSLGFFFFVKTRKQTDKSTNVAEIEAN